MKTEMPDPPSRNYHLEIADERDRLRAEVERLTRENTAGCALNERLTKERIALCAEVERLTRERDEEITQKWIAVDGGEAMRRRCIFDRDAAIRRAEAAERQVATLREALIKIADLTDKPAMLEQDRPLVTRIAEAALAETEKKDG